MLAVFSLQKTFSSVPLCHTHPQMLSLLADDWAWYQRVRVAGVSGDFHKDIPGRNKPSGLDKFLRCIWNHGSTGPGHLLLASSYPLTCSLHTVQCQYVSISMPILWAECSDSNRNIHSGIALFHSPYVCRCSEVETQSETCSASQIVCSPSHEHAPQKLNQIVCHSLVMKWGPKSEQHWWEADDDVSFNNSKAMSGDSQYRHHHWSSLLHSSWHHPHHTSFWQVAMIYLRSWVIRSNGFNVIYSFTLDPLELYK